MCTCPVIVFDLYYIPCASFFWLFVNAVTHLYGPQSKIQPFIA